VSDEQEPKPPMGGREWPLIFVATALFISSAVRARMDGVADPIVASLLCAGLIAFGAWIAMEVRNR